MGDPVAEHIDTVLIAQRHPLSTDGAAGRLLSLPTTGIKSSRLDRRVRSQWGSERVRCSEITRNAVGMSHYISSHPMGRTMGTPYERSLDFIPSLS